MAEVHGPERPRRRGRTLRIVVLTLLLLLIAGTLVLDRFSNSYAENVLAEQVATEVANQKAESSRPVVTIAGVPFLTQVLAGRYEDIRIELPDFKAESGTGETVRMDLLDIHARDVTAPLSALRGGGEVRAGSVTGTGTINYQLLAEATGQQGLKLAERDGKLVGSGVLAITQTQEIPLTATAELTVTDGRVQVRFSDVNTPGLTLTPLIQSQVDTFVQGMAFELDVPKLPLDLVVQELRPLPEGLRVTFGATDVNLAVAGV